MARLELSVHELVDFILRKGDIDNRVFNRSSMQEGTLLHALYQSKQGENYLSEYPLSLTLFHEDIEIYIEGRADGIIKRGKDKYIIDEIKTTVIDLEEFFLENEGWHLGQAEVYAYMFLKEKNLKEIGIKLTYISQKNHQKRLVKDYKYSEIELEIKIHQYLEEYLSFYHLLEKLKKERDQSIDEIKFPFTHFRKGQKELSKYVYGVASKGGKLFIEAPTGIGKTMSTLFPSIKTIKDTEKSKIFYLTAKSSGKENAFNALKIINSKGGKLSFLLMTAKEKICFCKGKSCNPDECPYTKGYYNKIGQVIKYSILSLKEFSQESIIRIAKEYEICPFEFELDLSLFLDVIICDYNYVFDPISYMHRYFDENSSSYLLLIDEAHNLIDRSRDMYTASISEEEFISAKKSMKKTTLRKVKTQLSKLKKYFDSLHEIYKEENNVLADFNEETLKTLRRFSETILEANKNDYKEISKELLEFYLNVLRFIKIYEIASDSFIYNVKLENNHISLELICLDASKYLKEITNRMKASIYFSATLSPINYYVDTLGGSVEDDATLKLDSPFPKENFLLLVAPKVSVKYKNRESSYETVRDYIFSFVHNKVGNYLIFLPSYEYLFNLKKYIDFPNMNIFYQDKDMMEEDRLTFIENFVPNPTTTNLGFAILGGSFAEGIDLVSDRLIGAVVVGIGMPRINFISDQIKQYYDEKEISGYNYAYLFPGMNKVMQAVGRVIRDEEDKGAVLLVDERYTTASYQSLFKKEWSNYEIVFTPEEVEEEINKFYKN